MRTIELLLITMRPYRWSRSAVIFLPLIFSGDPLNWVYLLKIFVGFLIFSLLTGAINIIEDIISVESDRNDPIKRLFPVASGELSVNKAEFSLGAVLVGSFVASFFLGPGFGIAAVLYFFISLAYFLYLKKIVFMDIVIVATAAGIVISAGTAAISKPVSGWLVFFVFMSSAFVALSGRTRELILAKRSEQQFAGLYEEKQLEQSVMISASSALIVYAMYCLSSPDGTNFNMIYTLPLAVYGIYRVLFLTNDNVTEAPLEKLLLRDPFFLGTVIVWVITVSVLLAL
ncbi:MAG: UbiA prenyltransferase family protein [Candidatus Margulisiibacteriota bacterium]